MAKQKALAILLLFGSVAFTLALAEVALHTLDYPPLISDEGRFLVPDSTRGWRNVANIRGEYVSDEYRHSLRYNELGYRGELQPFEKPSNTVRILILGDSFIDGYSVEQKDRVSEVLEQKLNSSGLTCHVQVIPLGTAGYSTDQELLWLRQVGLRFQPDITALFFYYNDIWYNTQSTYFGTPKPVFTFHGDSVMLRAPQMQRRNKPAEHTSAELSTIDWLKQHSRLYRLAERVAKQNSTLRSLAVRFGFAPLQQEMYTTAGSAVIPAEFAVYRTPMSPEVATAWSATERLLGAMKSDVQTAGGSLIIFEIPIRAQVYGKAANEGPIGTSKGWDLNLVDQHLKEICTRDAIECIEPIEQYTTVAHTLAKQGQRLYYTMDQHWNSNGHFLAAALLARRLLPEVRAKPACQSTAR